MENDEILCMMENFESVWARVAAVPDVAAEIPLTPLQSSTEAQSQQISAYQPRWFCVF